MCFIALFNTSLNVAVKGRLGCLEHGNLTLRRNARWCARTCASFGCTLSSFIRRDGTSSEGAACGRVIMRTSCWSLKRISLPLPVPACARLSCDRRLALSLAHTVCGDSFIACGIYTEPRGDNGRSAPGVSIIPVADLWMLRVLSRKLDAVK